jgi:demethylmenaquinone methyltransferase/2-methoxy-6-polyprenyl-1,4-benzoquinol methylase
VSDGRGVPTTEKVRGVFTRIARDYDRMNRILSMGLDRGWRRRLVREAGLTSGCAVLDVAAGTGDVAFALTRTGVPAFVATTDFTPEMLDIARARADADPSLLGGPTQLRFEHQDGQALTYADDTFDVVTVAFGIRNMPDRAAGFREARRVLKPGGRYLVLEFSRPRAWFRPMFYLYTGTVVPLLGALVARDRASYQYLNDSIRAFPGQESLASELTQAGFREVRWVDMMFGAVALHIATK